MSETPIGYLTKIEPTEAELNLIARLRQLSGIYPYDADSKTLWVNGKPEYMNGKRSKYARPELPFDMGGQ